MAHFRNLYETVAYTRQCESIGEDGGSGLERFSSIGLGLSSPSFQLLLSSPYTRRLDMAIMTRSAGSLCVPGKVDATNRGIFRAEDGRPVDSTTQPAVYYVPRIRDFVQDEQEAKAHISFTLNPERRILMTFVAMQCH